MSEIRLAKRGETSWQKEIWKRCFGDPDSYIDFYYANRYREDETVVLLHEGEISAMLTRIPVKTVIPDSRSFETAMLYAIATHPKYQNRGFAARLIDFSGQYLGAAKSELSILVPAKVRLFDYYRKLGFQDGFYIRENLLTRERIESLPIHKGHCVISSAAPEEYNRRRNKQLNGRLFVSYHDEDIAYQKKLSQLSGTDIYGVDIGNIQGCLAVERMTTDKLLIKELLVPEDYISVTIKQIVKHLPAKEYFLRTPGFLGEHLGGSIRPFGMLKLPKGIELMILPENLGYLGFAFD